MRISTRRCRRGADGRQCRTGAALALPERTECLAGAKPGGGFDVTCRLAANSPVGGQAHRAADDGDLYGRWRQGHRLQPRCRQTIRRSRPPLSPPPPGPRCSSQGKFGSYDENAVRWLGALGADTGVIVVNADSPYKTSRSCRTPMRPSPRTSPSAVAARSAARTG